MGRKKKTEDGEGPKSSDKEPPWFDDPYDYSIPWGAKITNVKEIAEELDKAPPLSYFKDKIKELIPKKKRRRRKKNEWDDLLKDPLTELRKGIEFLKQRNQTNQQGSSQEKRVNGSDKPVDKKREGLEENITVAKESSESHYVEDTEVLNKDSKESFAMENTTTDQKYESVTKGNEVKEVSKSINETVSSASNSDSKGVVKKKNKTRKEDKYKNRITELSKELEELKSRFELFTKAVSSSSISNLSEKKLDESSINKETLADSTEKETDHLQTTVNSELKSPKEKEISLNTGDSKTEKIKDNEYGTKEALEGSTEKEGDKNIPNSNSKSNFPIESLKSDSTELKNKNNSIKTEKHVMTEKESINPEVSRTKPKTANEKIKESSKSDSSKKKKIKSSMKEKRKEKEDKEFKKFKKLIKDFDDKNLEKDSNVGNSRNNFGMSERGSTIAESFYEERGGKKIFPSRNPGFESISESNNMFGTSPFPLDSEFINDVKNSEKKVIERNISKFINSTLQPGDGFVLSPEKKDDS